MASQNKQEIALLTAKRKLLNSSEVHPSIRHRMLDVLLKPTALKQCCNQPQQTECDQYKEETF